MDILNCVTWVQRCHKLINLLLNITLFTIFLSGMFGPMSLAVADEHEERIRFAPGASSATVTGDLASSGWYSYRFRAAAFQEIKVSIKSEEGKAYFYVFAPGIEYTISQKTYDKWTSSLPKTGEYILALRADGVKTRYILEVTITSKKVRKTPRPTQAEAKKLCEFIVSSHSGSTKEISAQKLYQSDGKIDINNDGVQETVKTCWNGTMGGDCFRFIGQDNRELSFTPIAFEKDYWTFGERILSYDQRTYLVHFREESLLFPSYVSYVDVENWVQPVCEFINTVTESVGRHINEQAFCAQLISTDRPALVSIQENHNLILDNPDTWRETTAGPAVQVDFDNDGEKESLVLITYTSGAGRGCGCEYFDLLNKTRDGILPGKKRDQLLKLQDISISERHPCAHCNGNKPGWFVDRGITFFENKYPGDAPLDASQTFHKVSYLKDGEIRISCEYEFTVKTQINKYFSLD